MSSHEYLNYLEHKEDLVNNLEFSALPVVHIAFGINNAYARGMGITIFSILENNPSLAFHVHVFGSPLDEKSKLLLLELATNHPLAITCYVFRESAFSDLPLMGRYPQAIYYRLFTPYILSEVTSKLIYLDADTLCLGSYKELHDTDISHYTLAAVNDTQRARNKLCPQLGLKSGNYFNSGFLYINIPRWLEKKTTERIIKTLSLSEQELKFPDQDALNITLENEVLLLPKKYNFICDIILNKVGKSVPVPPDTILIHYTGKCKPWHLWGLGELSAIYDRYYEKSPWRAVPHDMPVSYKEMKRYAQALWHERQYMPSLCWMAKYMNNKIFGKTPL
ncbi:sugar glycosyltransferase [Rahnella sp. AA]|uniref:glycosyltransferase family 8 protein n=1 Tax=Rahnella sp. AA TaxID=2057180 RepID=UPI000C33E2A3|nr:glycosyltransferase [Rahnella sp. AA]PKE27773.1 sugar glycosyltransferase [Rahnella sp. AA]